MPGRRAKLGEKGIMEELRRIQRGGGGGAGGGVTPHPLFGPFHNDTVTASPVEGALALADDTPEWNILLHPEAAGYAMVTDATTWTIDQTPTWTGDHTWDDDTGDSPKLHLIPENDDDWQIWAANDATPGNSDLIIKFPAADTDSYILFRDSGDNDVGHIDADGNTAFDGAAHRFGVEDVVAAIVTISGHATGSDEGGQFTLELADDHDAVFNSWNIDVNQDDLRFFRSDAGVINAMTAEGLLSLSVSGSGAGLLIAGDAQWYRSAANVMATPDDLYLAGAGLGIIHVDGVAAGQILVANNTRYVPGTISDAGGAPNDAQYLTLALDGDLSAERRFVPGDGLAGTDGGADGDYDLVVDLVAAWSGLEFSAGDLRVDLDAIYSWTGAHYHSATVVMDDGAGNSPAFQFIGGSNDDAAVLYLADDAVAGDSDFAIALSGTDADSRLLIQTSGFATAAWIDASGDASFADVYIASGSGIIHADGVAAGWLLVADGARYAPADPATSLPIAPGARGDIIRAEAGPVWNNYSANTLGAVLIGDGTDIISDTTPTIAGLTTLNAGWAIPNAGGWGDLDGNALIIDQDGDSYLYQVADDHVGLVMAGASGQFTVSINGASDFTFTANSFNVLAGSDVSFASGTGIIHADGVAAGWLLVADGTRYVPANPAASLPIAPGARGDIIRAEAGPVWNNYAAATLGAVLIGDGTDIVSDTSPTFVDDITLDDGAGDSPEIVFITGANNDEAAIWLDEDLAGAGASDLRVQLCDAAGASQFEIRDSGSAVVAYVTSDGDALFADVDINGNDLIIDADGDSYLHASADDVVDLVLAGASGEFGIHINGAEDFTVTANSLNILSGSAITMADDTTIQLAAAGGQIIFDSTTAPDQIKFKYADLVIEADDGTDVLTIARSGDATVEPDILANGNLSLAAVDGVYVLLDTDDTGVDTQFSIMAHDPTTGGADELFRVQENARVGVNAPTPLAMLHVDQSSTTAAIQTLYLDQADVDIGFIKFVGTAAAGTLTNSIVDEGDQSSETRTGWLKVFVQDDGNQIADQNYFIPIYVLS